MRYCYGIRRGVLALLLLMASIAAARAVGDEPVADPRLDPGACVAAAAANDDEKILASCGALIDNDKTAKPDRIMALLARARVFDRKGEIDRAIADLDTVLQLDPQLADSFNARGELWRRKGDRPKALQDFAAALRLNPGHVAAKANTRSLAQELELLGAALGALARYPEVLLQAAAQRAPHALVHFLRELANAFHSWYNAATFIVEDAPLRNARLALAFGVQQVLRNGFVLLGISAPESM